MSIAHTPLRRILRNQVFPSFRAVTDTGAGTVLFGSAQLRSMFRSELGRKSTLYFAALLANAVLGIVVYGLLTRVLTVTAFGTYAFITAFFVFTTMFFDFGIAPAGKRLVAMTEDRALLTRRIGALLVLSSGVGLIYAVFVALVSFAVEAWFHAGAGQVLLMVAPLAVVFHLQEMLFAISQGSSRITLLSVFLLLPRVILIVLLLVVIAAGTVDLRLAVTATLMSTGTAIGITAGILRPSFEGLRDELRTIGVEVREFGRDMYTGRVVDGLVNGLDKILLSYFHGMVPVGYYTIAMTMSTPVSMFTTALSQSAYQRFVYEDRIPRRILVVSLLWCTIGAAVLFLACQTLIPLFFTDRYTESLAVLPWVMSGFALAGLNHSFHSFLAAKRQGRAIRTMSIVCSAVSVTLNLALIPLLGMTGAAIAFLSTYAVNIVMNIRFYRRAAGKEHTQSEPDETVNG